MSVLKTRIYCLLPQDDFKVPSKGLIAGWKIIGGLKPSYRPQLIINGVKVPTEWSSSDKSVLSIGDLRKYLRELYPDSEAENKLIQLEQHFLSLQIQAVQHYDLPTSEFFNSMFTHGLDSLNFSFGKKKPKIIRVEESYYEAVRKI